MYFVDGDDGGLYRYTAGDGVQPVLTETPTVSLAADADGNLYLGRATSIVKYDPEEETETELVTGLGSAPVDVAVSESGELFYATADGTIRRKGTLDWEPTTVATGIEGLTAIAVRTLPRMPGGASAEGGDRQAQVFWATSETNGGPSDIRYEVETFVGDEIGEPVPTDVPICATRLTTCTITNLTNGEYYTFHITAFNTPDGDNTGRSNPFQSNGIRPRVGPEAPTLGTPTPGNRTASVAFTPGDDNGVNATAWQVSSDRLIWSGAEVYATGENEFEAVFRGLENGQANNLYVRAYDPVTETTGKVATATVTPDDSLPGTPRIERIQPGDKSATLYFWPVDQGASEITGYEASVDGLLWVPAYGSEGPPAEEPSTPPSDDPADEPSPTPTPEPTDEPSPTPTPEPTGEPSASADAVGEPAQVMSDQDELDGMQSVVINDLTLPFHHVRLRARNQQGPGVATTARVYPGQVVAPSVPMDVQTESADKQLTVTFMPSMNPADGYEVQLAEGGDWKQLPLDDAERGGRLGGTVTDLVNGTAYQVRVRGVNTIGPGEGSVPVTGIPARPPSAPSQVTATADATSAVLTFLPSADDGDDPDHLAYEISFDAGEDWTTLTTEPGDDGTLVATIPDLTVEDSFEILLRARNGGGASEHLTVTVTPATAPTTSPATSAPTNPPSETPTSPTTTSPSTAPTMTSPTTTSPTTPAPTTTPPTTPPPTTTTTPPTTTPPTTEPTTPAPTTAPTSEPPTPAPSSAAPVVPDAPTGVTATAGLNSITVSWNPPADNGAVITGYRATATPGGASCTSTGTSCVVGGDTRNAYTFRVVALSAAGESRNSMSSNPVTPNELTVPAAAPVTDLPLETPDGPVTSAARGGRLKMAGNGYAPFSVITLAVYSEPTILGTVTADADGAFETEIDVPEGLSLGTHSFVAAGVDKNGKFRALRLDLTVAEAADTGATLPVTGAAVLWLAVAGFVTVGAGVVTRRLARPPA
ncbi:fibronectin type III domain-containing protein [Paractinoplanes brasiliensis]|uniref:Fibronectin type III domain protein n=1 Tax=Paractinoplanes brasiliensis TaxID=52695 RepID=A0A4R6J9N9_9ACTN|nr:fibronectin type III domain-containing protein [Actinoplanes brasiliensis]TDO32329.1 fibronectin type III domain protein [Actinoplanes brasiliensis]GID27805.1 hypothetical protein Abr02nite_27880 [Actinoplanes brasiliensis]